MFSIRPTNPSYLSFCNPFNDPVDAHFLLQPFKSKQYRGICMKSCHHKDDKKWVRGYLTWMKTLHNLMLPTEPSFDDSERYD